MTPALVALNAVCARCIRPMKGDQFNTGRFTYGECCVLKVHEQNPALVFYTERKRL